MHIQVRYKSAFIRQFNKLPSGLQEEVYEVVERFKNLENHKTLRVHKLKGPLAECYSFSINYQYRIVFMWEKKSKKTAVLLAIGDHDMYR